MGKQTAPETQGNIEKLLYEYQQAEQATSNQFDKTYLQGRIAGLKDAIGCAMPTQDKSITDALTTAQARIKELEEEITQKTTDLSAITVKVEELQADKDKLQDTLEKAESATHALEAEIEKLQNTKE